MCFIKWLNGKKGIQVLNLQYWLQGITLQYWSEHIIQLNHRFQLLNFQHIYRDWNQQADHLSKKVLLVGMGHIYLEYGLGTWLLRQG